VYSTVRDEIRQQTIHKRLLREEPRSRYGPNTHFILMLADNYYYIPWLTIASPLTSFDAATQKQTNLKKIITELRTNALFVKISVYIYGSLRFAVGGGTDLVRNVNSTLAREASNNSRVGTGEGAD
jgi:hypothetical protein